MPLHCGHRGDNLQAGATIDSCGDEMRMLWVACVRGPCDGVLLSVSYGTLRGRTHIALGEHHAHILDQWFSVKEAAVRRVVRY